METNKIKILGMAGSLRSGSYNRGLLRVAVELAIPEADVEIFDLTSIPIYNADLEVNMPAIVLEFKKKIENADAILLVTPEYNYSISGVLKNAIDWGSRPYGQNSFEDKPVAIMGASSGSHGTSRAQYQLRQILVDLNMHAINTPELMVSGAKEKFDGNGNLTDEKTKERVKMLLVALTAWTKRLRQN